MKVWVVIQTSYTPSYGDSGYDESKSIFGIYATEEAAKAIYDAVTVKKNSIWSPDYEMEEFDVQS